MLIGITGPAGSGKTTAANIIAWGHSIDLVGFADPVRQAVVELFRHGDIARLELDKDRRQSLTQHVEEVELLLWRHVWGIYPHALIHYAAQTGDDRCGVGQAAMTLMGIDDYDVHGPPSVWWCTPRHALRTIGDFGRGIDPYLYLHAMGERLAQDGDEPMAVIHDVRLDIEAQWIRERGGVLLHMQRPGVVWSREHATEYGVTFEPGDQVIVNTGQMAPLRAEILHSLSHVAAGRRCA